MAFTNFERERYERAVAAFIKKRRPPPHIRPQLDLGYRISGQSVEIFEIRPQWDKPEVKRESPVAKATYVKTRNVWRVFWQRRDLKWHAYDPLPETGTLEEFLQAVDEDSYACFFG